MWPQRNTGIEVLENLRGLYSEIVHRFYWRPRRKRIFEAQNKSFICVTPDGLRFALEPGQFVDRYIATEGIYERRFLRFFREVLPRGGVMIDIGANIGNHALYLHDHCSVVHCYEPNPTAAARLRHNIELNHATNVHVHEVGLGDRDATLPFASNIAGNLGNSGFLDGQEHEAGTFETIQLPIRRADEAIRELDLSRIDFIKIDVEGLEEQIFSGLKETIHRFRPLLAFEFHGHLTPAAAFEHIRGCLPGYIVADMAFAPDDSGALSTLLYHLRHGNRLTLRAVDTPRARTYESLLAIPDEHPLRARLLNRERIE